jgi:parvulin-like peptidyl-prolyl isomerase
MDPFSRGQVAKPIEDAAFALKQGQVSEVVTTPEGFHIIKLEELSAAIIVTEDQAREKIRNFLQVNKANAAIEKEGARLRAVGKVDILLPI